MQTKLKVYNTLSRQKEVFEPLNPPFVGMYVCGPTVYSDVHLGNCRTFTSFDIIFRYLKYLGYKVRYVRNITDVGHLVNDADEGEDKIGRKAKLENLEPMEIVQRYTVGFRQVMDMLNNIPPSIEPTATGHILEQIEMTQSLLDKGLAYESAGSVYFDVRKYNETQNYGQLSGRNLDELLAGQRDLDGQSEKRSPEDFALWKNASPEHIMRWNSPWGIGFPGWHIECSVMSSKYLGKRFDIHGGGMDLKFPHHECEIAQSVGHCGEEPSKYWLHTNMLTVNGQRMGKSVGNAILPHELFTGNHPLLDRAYSPMTLRFFMLQTHYRSTMDISVEALAAARKGYKKVVNGLMVAKKLQYVENPEAEISAAEQEQISRQIEALHEGMDDDFNTAKALAALFNLLKKINSLETGHIQPAEIGKELFDKLIETYIRFTEDVLGILEESPEDTAHLTDALIDIYKDAKQHKDYDRVDRLRAQLREVGIVVKDMKNGISWAYEE